MKATILFFTALLFFSWAEAQSLQGAWKLTHQDGQEVKDIEYIKIYQDDYFAFGAKQVADNHFISAGGGPFAYNDGNYVETLDFLELQINTNLIG